MKSKIKVVPIVLFLSVFILLISCQKQKDDWKGTIEEEDGVTAVKNPKEPMFGEISLELEEDMSIGREDDENYLLYRIRDIAVDGLGNIYVVDMGNIRVQVFDRSGDYLQTIGRAGEGPGEFLSPRRIKIDDDDGKIYIVDAGREIEIFDKEGKFVNRCKQERPIGAMTNLWLEKNGNLIVKIFWGNESGNFHALYNMNSQGNIGKILGNIGKILVEYPYNEYIENRGGVWVGGSTGYELSLCFEKLDKRRFIYGYPIEYKLHVVNNEGDVLFIIKKDEPRPTYTSEEVEKHKARQRGPLRIPPPDVKPYFYQILTDSQGRIYVQRNMTTEGGPIDRTDKEVDVFNNDGYYLFKTTLPANTYVIRDGLLYVYVLDEEEGGEYVKRYKIRNWGQIKTWDLTKSIPKSQIP
ncbi:MAG: 6-bladed beta-propeller [Candidatus Aminicenantes bacterium]|nr:6-bladed beta-propeller [Candidatus Aminicenantes bacterium]